MRSPEPALSGPRGLLDPGRSPSRFVSPTQGTKPSPLTKGGLTGVPPPGCHVSRCRSGLVRAFELPTDKRVCRCHPGNLSVPATERALATGPLPHGRGSDPGDAARTSPVLVDRIVKSCLCACFVLDLGGRYLPPIQPFPAIRTRPRRAPGAQKTRGADRRSTLHIRENGYLRASTRQPAPHVLRGTQEYRAQATRGAA